MMVIAMMQCKLVFQALFTHMVMSDCDLLRNILRSLTEYEIPGMAGTLVLEYHTALLFQLLELRLYSHS